jgi:hypothetical protein
MAGGAAFKLLFYNKNILNSRPSQQNDLSNRGAGDRIPCRGSSRGQSPLDPPRHRHSQTGSRTNAAPPWSMIVAGWLSRKRESRDQTNRWSVSTASRRSGHALRPVSVAPEVQHLRRPNLQPARAPETYQGSTSQPCPPPSPTAQSAPAVTSRPPRRASYCHAPAGSIAASCPPTVPRQQGRRAPVARYRHPPHNPPCTKRGHPWRPGKETHHADRPMPLRRHPL